MLRYGLVVVAVLAAAGPALSANWADGLFEEFSKDFGSVPRGPTLSHAFKVVNNTRETVNIASLRVSCGCVSATAHKGSLEPGETTHLVARMDTTRFTGHRTVTIYVQFNQPAFQEVRLWVQANCRNDFSITPDTLAFGQLKRGGTPTASVLLAFYGNTDAQITEVKCESNYIQPRVQEVRRSDSEVTFQVTAQLRSDAPVGKWYTDVWVKTNSAGAPPIRVPLNVEIESALSVNPETVTLGPIKTQSESERRVIVRGVKPFKIDKVLGTNDRLLVHVDSKLAKPVHVLTIKLKAGDPGELNRTLSVLTDLADDNRIDFHISANVVP
ncbi:MAG TPA: DUF1573 domain-containing protein [Gemmataceae bacterium]|jgi:hypothetical protein